MKPFCGRNYLTTMYPSTSRAGTSSGNDLSPRMYITPKMPEEEPNLELAEFLNRLAGSGQDAQDVEADLKTVVLAFLLSVAHT